MKKVSKTQAKEDVEKFFADIRGKKPREVGKIKKLAMSNNIKLNEKRKEYCKKCLTPYTVLNSKVRISKGNKTVECKNCGYISRWKIK